MTLVNLPSYPIISDHNSEKDYGAQVEWENLDAEAANNNDYVCTINQLTRAKQVALWRNGSEGPVVSDVDQAHSSSCRSLTAYILWQASESLSTSRSLGMKKEQPHQQQQLQRQRQQAVDTPQPTYLWTGLLASCFLLLLSGFDGSTYCQMKYLHSDPDISSSCRSIFRGKIIPTSVALATFSLFSIRELALASSNNISSNQRRSVRIHVVGFSAVICLIVCTISVITIMLAPQARHNVQQDLDQLFPSANTMASGGSYYGVNGGKNYTTDDSHQVEFKEFFFHSPSIPYSLYAINGLGEIGDNANLYHAIFAAFIFAFIIAHQYLYALALLYLCKSYLYWKRNRLKTTLFFRHRERVGSWIAILVAAFLVLISSSLLWTDVLSEPCQVEEQQDDKLTMLSIHPRICSSTELAILMGTIGVIVSMFSVSVHSSSHRFSTRTVPLSLEGAASFILVLLYGFGNMFVTGSYQGGLAENVGNLYYATWCCFLFSLRVFIGCVEEVYALDHEEEEETVATSCGSSSSSSNHYTSYRGSGRMKLAATENSDGPSNLASAQLSDANISKEKGRGHAPASIENFKEENLHDDIFRYNNNSDSATPERPITFIKRWLTLALLSSINHGAAYDAAQQMYFTTFGYNTGSLKVMADTYGSRMSASQKWTIVCPFLVMCFSLAMAMLHLWPRSFQIVSKHSAGLLFALVASALCASQIFISQHATNSFAVNHLGEIVSANLYYFTWGSMFSAGSNVAFYYHRVNPSAESSFEFILWFGLVKVGLIMVGASSHLWIEIKDSCRAGLSQEDDIIATSFLQSASFCWRTNFSLYAGLIVTSLSICVSGMLVLKCNYVIWFQNIVGSALTAFLTLGVGFITGMGGPGASVGDLYYSTWLAFALSVAISSSWIKKSLKNRVLQEVNNDAPGNCENNEAPSHLLQEKCRQSAQDPVKNHRYTNTL